MKNIKIPFARPWITDEDREAVFAVLHRDVLTHGPEGKAFEEEFSQWTRGQGHAISLSSGMAALHLAYLALGIGPGDEVLVPAQTHIATVHAVEWVGARPIFVDCDPATGNINTTLLEKHLTPQTKAIGLVHFVGIPCEMETIVQFAKSHGLKIVEDCAIALGSFYQGKHVGLLGDAGCFSFYPVKHMTTGDGGMLLTRHRELAQKIRQLRGFGVDRTFSERVIPGFYDVPTLGLNYRMSDINAALGRSQLKRLNIILEKRRNNFAYLYSRFKSLSDIHILHAPEKDTQNSHYCCSVVLKGSLANKRNQIVQLCNDAGIGTSIYYPQPVPRMKYYEDKYHTPKDIYKEASIISDHGIALSVGPHLTQEDLVYMADKFTEVVTSIRS